MTFSIHKSVTCEPPNAVSQNFKPVSNNISGNPVQEVCYRNLQSALCSNFCFGKPSAKRALYHRLLQDWLSSLLQSIHYPLISRLYSQRKQDQQTCRFTTYRMKQSVARRCKSRETVHVCTQSTENRIGLAYSSIQSLHGRRMDVLQLCVTQELKRNPILAVKAGAWPTSPHEDGKPTNDIHDHENFDHCNRKNVPSDICYKHLEKRSSHHRLHQQRILIFQYQMLATLVQASWFFSLGQKSCRKNDEPDVSQLV